jgi:predicted N-acetyltransferase YhbS
MVLDEGAIHFLAYQDKVAIGCARAIIHHNAMQLGRMAVLKEHRDQGVGSALIEKAITTSKLNHLQAYLSVRNVMRSIFIKDLDLK